MFLATNLPTKLRCLDVKTGKERWSEAHPGSIIYSSPAVSAGLVVVGGSDDQTVRAIDVRTGAERWRRPTRARVLTSPAVEEGIVYFGDTEAYITAVGLSDGEPRGATHTEASVHSSRVIADGMLYIGSDDDHLYAFERVLHRGDAKQQKQ